MSRFKVGTAKWSRCNPSTGVRILKLIRGTCGKKLKAALLKNLWYMTVAITGVKHLVGFARGMVC